MIARFCRFFKCAADVERIEILLTNDSTVDQVKQCVNDIRDIVNNYTLNINPDVPTTRKGKFLHYLGRFFSFGPQNFWCGETGRTRAAQMNDFLNDSNATPIQKLQNLCDHAYIQQDKAKVNSLLCEEILKRLASRMGLEKRSDYVPVMTPHGAAVATVTEHDSVFYLRIKQTLASRLAAIKSRLQLEQQDAKEPQSERRLSRQLIG